MDEIKKAIEIFKKGGVVIFPTDTAIGIGCRIDNENSLKRLFKIRNRPENKPVIALVDSVEMAQKYLLPIPQEVKDKLIRRYWPGRLTIILKCKKSKVPVIAMGGGDTLGVRFPKNKNLLELIKRVGVPIAAPSANFAGKETPYSFDNLNPELVKQADYILTGKISSQRNVSTIIDCTITPWKVIRQGAIKIKSLTLLLDTSNNQKITVGLIIDNKKYIQTKTMVSNSAQIILPMINEILDKYSLKQEDLSEIEINTGPGSFTGLRVGLAIANALSFALKIPINGKKVGDVILPIYK